MARHNIEGNTYPHRDALKAMGCTWDAQARCWYTMAANVAAKARELVASGSKPAGGRFSLRPAAPKVDKPEVAESREHLDCPIKAAAKFGRTASPDAKIVAFGHYGLARGDDGLPNGEIRIVRGVRYVQVARDKRSYLSQADLEDMGQFNVRAGGFYQWWGVAVEPTAFEQAVDAAAAVEAAREARRKAIIDIVRQGANHIDDGNASVAGLTKLAKFGATRAAGSETLYVGGDTLVYVASSYDDYHAWKLTDAALAAESVELAK